MKVGPEEGRTTEPLGGTRVPVVQSFSAGCKGVSPKPTRLKVGRSPRRRDVSARSDVTERATRTQREENAEGGKLEVDGSALRGIPGGRHE